MNNENASKKDNIIKTLHKKLKTAGCDFHMYNYVLPAFVPIAGIAIALAITNLKNAKWQDFCVSSLSQLLYFAFFILISNTILLYSKTISKTRSANLVISVIFIIIYISFSLNLYNPLYKFGWPKIILWLFIILVALYFVIGVYAMNPESPYNNNENDITTEISLNRASQENTTDDELN